MVAHIGIHRSNTNAKTKGGRTNTNNTSSCFHPVPPPGTRATFLPTQLRCLRPPRSHLQLQDLTTTDQPPSPRDLPPHLVSRRTALGESVVGGFCATTWEGGLPQPLRAPPRSTRHTASVPPRPQPTTVSSFRTPFPTSGPPPCQLPSSTVPPDPRRLLGASSRVSGLSPAFASPWFHLLPFWFHLLSLFVFDLVPSSTLLLLDLVLSLIPFLQCIGSVPLFCLL